MPTDEYQLIEDVLTGQMSRRDLIKRLNILNWKEGTLGHDPVAGRDFVSCVDDLREKEPDWFGKGSPAETWLLDTGDLSTFGDRDSLSEGQNFFEGLKARLGGCRFRTIYGNHDAWPGIQPILLPERDYKELMREQMTFLRSWNEWDFIPPPVPLSVAVPGAANARIELYALNSVCEGLFDNARAVGHLERTLLDSLEQDIQQRSS